jgi:putative ABC transport system permease protein
MLNLWQDLRYGFRVLRKARGFTAAAVLTLGLGIGAAGAIFSLVDAALLRPLPFKQADRLVMLSELTPGRIRNSVSALTYLDWRDQSKSFESVAAVTGGSHILKSPGGPEHILSQSVSASFFDLLGVQAALGRTFEKSDEDPGAPGVAVIGYGLWQRLGADRGLVGRPLLLDGRPITVAGVLPAGFTLFNNRCEVWTPLSLSRATARRDSHFLQVIARLKPETPRDSVQAEMDVIAGRIAAASPATNQGWGVAITPLQEFLVGSDLKSTSLLLFAAVGLILLIACVNVANLLLARQTTRAREMAVRVAIGAGRARLIAQMLAESLLIGALGGVLGIWLAWLAVETLPSILPAGAIPSAIPIRMDTRVILFALAVSLLTPVLFGLLPALRIAKISLGGVLRASGRTTTGARRSLNALASVEIALAIIVLAGAGLLVRTLFRLENVDRGYRAANILTMHVSLPENRYATPERLSMFYRDAGRELAAVPGVRSVAIGIDMPLEGWSMGTFFEVAGAPKQAQRTGAHVQSVNPGYFETLGIRVLAGRTFSPEDTPRGKPVCIVNEAFAARFFDGSRAVGAQVNVSGSPTHPDLCEIAGVIGQVKVQGPGEPNALEIYLPMSQAPFPAAAIAVRTAGDPLSLSKAATAAIHRVDADLPVTQMRTLESIAENSVNRPRMRAGIAAAFAGIAALLACMGIFGVLSYSVSQRIREIGVRMALGARPANVLGLVLGEGSRIAVTGIVAGLAGAALLTRYMATLLWGVPAMDPLTFTAVPALFATVALLACAIPARRASRVDPATVLQAE